MVDQKLKNIRPLLITMKFSKILKNSRKNRKQNNKKLFMGMVTTLKILIFFLLKKLRIMV